jgi:cell division ATPase FtsA
VAVALRTPTQNAEEIKMLHACALTQLADVNEMIDVPSIGDRPSRQISKQNLAEIIEPRYEELMLYIINIQFATPYALNNILCRAHTASYHMHFCF